MVRRWEIVLTPSMTTIPHELAYVTVFRHVFTLKFQDKTSLSTKFCHNVPSCHRVQVFGTALARRWLGLLGFYCAGLPSHQAVQCSVLQLTEVGLHFPYGVKVIHEMSGKAGTKTRVFCRKIEVEFEKNLKLDINTYIDPPSY